MNDRTDDMAVMEAEARHAAMTDRSQPRLGSSRARPLDEAAQGQIYRQALRGIPAEALAKQLGRSCAEIEQVINEMRARRLLETRLEFIADESFDAPGAAGEILGPDPVADKPAASQRRGRAPEGLPPYLASLYDVPLLAPEQERHLFRKMNYLKYRAHQLREQLDPTRARTEEINAIEWLQEEALAVKNQIIRANLRLVVSIAKRHVGPSNNFFE